MSAEYRKLISKVCKSSLISECIYNILCVRCLKNVRLGDIRVLSFFLFLWSAQKQLLMLSGQCFFFWNVNYKIWQDGVGKHRKASNAYNATLASVICLQKLYFNLLAWYAVSSLIILAITSNSYHSWLKKGSALLLIFARSRLCAYNFLPKKLSSTFLLKTCVTLR